MHGDVFLSKDTAYTRGIESSSLYGVAIILQVTLT